MDTPFLIVHIAAGSLAILLGTVAIFVRKGADLHRSSGRFFVYAMIVMGVTATLVAIARDIPSQIGAGPLAAYFVLTGLSTVRPLGRRVDIVLIVIALWLATLIYAGAAKALAAGLFVVRGVPVPMSLFMGTVLLLAGIGDVRVLRTGAPTGPRRIARHLWRMCYAFWVATGSFFLGQMDEFPAWLQNGLLMSIPAFFPLAAMVYWIWKIRYRRAVARMTLRQAAVTGG